MLNIASARPWEGPSTTSSTTSAEIPAANGKARLWRRLRSVTRRQAMIGPIPDRSTRISASGTTKGLNAGGPTDTCVPVIASEISGKNVTQKITSASATSTRFCNRNTASRDKRESNRASDRSPSRRQIISPTEPISIVPISATKEMLSAGSETKAWIEDRIPDRTRNVPTMAIVPVPRISERFHRFSIPRFSWIMIECRNAVASSQGISAAFSTGSQAQ